MNLHEAVRQLDAIQDQITRCSVFRGYRAITVAGSGLMGIIAAIIQPWFVPNPTQDPKSFVLLWGCVALTNIGIVIAEVAWMCIKQPGMYQRREILTAVAQFVPSILMGAVITLVIIAKLESAAWMLPGIWAILFGLGAFASCHRLPPAVIWSAMYYMVVGTCLLLFTDNSFKLSPWTMVISFGVGQLLTAAILYQSSRGSLRELLREWIA